MPRRGEPIHVDSDLRHQATGRHMVDARHGLPQGQGLLKRADLLVNLLLQTHDSLLEPVPFLQKFGERKTMMSSHPTLQCLHQLRNLVF